MKEPLYPKRSQPLPYFLSPGQRPVNKCPRMVVSGKLTRRYLFAAETTLFFISLLNMYDPPISCVFTILVDSSRPKLKMKCTHCVSPSFKRPRLAHSYYKENRWFRGKRNEKRAGRIRERCNVFALGNTSFRCVS